MSTRQISRRRFLIAGCGGLCLLLAGCGIEADLATCPYGEVNDPYPGRCHRYFDGDGDGICDLSQVSGGAAADAAVAASSTPEATATTGPVAADEGAEVTVTNTPEEAVTAEATATSAATATSQVTATAAAATRTLCPKGLVYDPYPGRCHRYVDKNGDGYCDLSVVV